MRYTEQRKNALFASRSLDVGEDDYNNVLEILNTEFRTFGEGLVDIIEQKMGATIFSPIEYLVERCKEAQIPLSVIGSPNSLKSWFAGGPRPKKSEVSRRKMFALAFVLKLTKEETASLFHKVYLDRAFNQRNYKELIYYYCLIRGLSFQDAENLIAKVRPFNSADDKTVFTAYLASEASQIEKADELLTYIQTHGHNFSLNNESAKVVFRLQKEKAMQCAQQQSRMTWDDSFFYGKDRNSDSFLYASITERSVAGEKGTVTLPFKDSTFPKEIKNNFPQVKSLSEKVDSYEEIRKVIILLFSYQYWSDTQVHNGESIYNVEDIYDDYTTRLNTLLVKANLSELYYGNPFDWMFLYCTYADRPLDTFRGILSAVLDEED